MDKITLPERGDDSFWPVKLPPRPRPATSTTLRFDVPQIDHFRKRIAVRGWFAVPEPEGERLGLLVWLPLPAEGLRPKDSELVVDFAGDVTMPELLQAYGVIIEWATTEAAKRALFLRGV